MIIGCADLDSFFDGALAEHAPAFREHLAGCAHCQRVLLGRMQEAMIADVPPDVRVPDTRGGRRRVALLVSGGVALLGAVAAGMMFASHTEPPRGPPLEVALTVDRAGPVMRGSSAHIGDQLHVVARGARVRAIWVYRYDRELVASCPAAGGLLCTTVGSQLELKLELRARGPYAVVTLGAVSGLPTPTGAYDADLDAASRIDGSYQIGHLDVD